MIETLIDVVTFGVVVLSGVYFVVLGLACLFAAERAKGFFLAFASSSAKHYLEMVLRLAVGASLTAQAPRLEFSTALAVFGWMLIATTTALLLMPWRWHQRFAQRVLPKFVRYIGLVGIVSILLGVFILVLPMRRLG